MSKLKAGVIGLGVGERHVVGYEQHPQAELALICDQDPVKLKEVAARHPSARTTTNPADVLADSSLDIISIASYDSAHHEQVVTALQADKHVFVEKPLCLTRHHAERIRSLLGANPKLLLSARFPCRLIPRFVAVKELVEQKKFGTIYAVAGSYDYGRREKLTTGWRAKEPDYSIVLGGGIHSIDLLTWLIAQPIVSVAATGNRLALADTAFKANDFVKATIRFANDIIGDITCNFGGVTPHFHGLQIDGTAGTFMNRRERGELTTSPKPGSTLQYIEAVYPGDKGKLDHQFSFIDAIINGTPPLVTADQIFSSLAVCFAIEKAVASGGQVPVRPL